MTARRTALIVSLGFCLLASNAARAGGPPVAWTIPTSNSQPYGIAFGSDGKYWFTEASGNQIGRILIDDTAGAYPIDQYTIPTGNSLPQGICAGPDSNLWFTEKSGNKIGRITTTGVITEYALPTAGAQPQEICNGPDGALWFTEPGINKIGRISTAGVVTEYALPTASSSPFGIYAGSDGKLWVTLKDANKVASVTTTGTVTEYTIPTASSSPLGITLGSDNNMWFTESAASKVAKITTAGAITEYPLPVAGGTPTSIVTGPYGGLYVTEKTGTRITGMTTTGVFLTPYYPTAPAAGSQPTGIAFGPNTNATYGSFVMYTAPGTNAVARVFYNSAAPTPTPTPTPPPPTPTPTPTPTPHIATVSPDVGSTAGGTQVLIAGWGFQAGATVTVGGVAATNVVWGGPGHLGAKTGAHAPGLVDVVVTNPDTSTLTKTGAFTYVDVVPVSLKEDPAGNGVLEPGENVMVVPSWKNLTGGSLSLTGAATAFAGPPGATYSLTDAAASYGSVADGASADCQTATGDCYSFGVNSPVTRPAPHWDATFLETLSSGQSRTWTLHVGTSFTDLPTSDVSYPFVENIYHNQVTVGCAPGKFCPGDFTPRWQMAVFLSRAILRLGAAIPPSGTVGSSPYSCASGGISLFTDVAPTDVGCPGIHYIYSRAVTIGCAPGKYCPDDLTPRWQMAVFLARAMLGPGVPIPATGTVPAPYNCSAGGTSLFTDVAPTDVGCPGIHYIYSQAVTTGCAPGKYCPDDLTPRWQMAIFLVRAFQISMLF